MAQSNPIVVTWTIDDFFSRAEELKKVKNYKLPPEKWNSIGELSLSGSKLSTEQRKAVKSNSRIIFPYFTSPEFIIKKEFEHLFKLYIYPNGKSRDNKKKIGNEMSIALQLLSGVYADKDEKEAVLLTWKPNLVVPIEKRLHANNEIKDMVSDKIQIDGQAERKAFRHKFVHYEKLRWLIGNKLELQVKIEIVDDTRVDFRPKKSDEELAIRAICYFNHLQETETETVNVKTSSSNHQLSTLAVQNFASEKLCQLVFSHVITRQSSMQIVNVDDNIFSGIVEWLHCGTIRSIANIAEAMVKQATEWELPELLLISLDWTLMKEHLGKQALLLQRYETSVGKVKDEECDIIDEIEGKYKTVAGLVTIRPAIEVEKGLLPFEKLLLEITTARERKTVDIVDKSKQLLTMLAKRNASNEESNFDGYHLQYRWLVEDKFPFSEAIQYERLFEAFFRAKQKRDQNVFVYLLLDPGKLAQDALQMCASNERKEQTNLSIEQWLNLKFSNAKQLACFISAIFYVGKGQNRRPFDHFKATALDDSPSPSQKISEKLQRIDQIYASGKEPLVLFAITGLSDAEASTREALFIDSLWSHLSNSKRESSRMALNKHQRDLLSAYFLFKAFLVFQINGARAVKQESVKLEELQVKIKEEEEEIIIDLSSDSEDI